MGVARHRGHPAREDHVQGPFDGLRARRRDQEVDAVLRARHGHATSARPTSAAAGAALRRRRRRHADRGRRRSPARSSRAQPARSRRSSARAKTAEVCLVYLAPDKGDLDRGQLPARPRTSTRSPGPASSRSPSRPKDSRASRTRATTATDSAAAEPAGVGMADPAPDNGACPPCPTVADASGPIARRDPGGARADGGHHQRGVPAAVRRAGRRALRLRDDHQPRRWSSGDATTLAMLVFDELE